MRTSSFPLNTVKETPSDAEIISHQLMIRAGLIRKLASGLYTWLPLGLRVLRKVERIVRAEMEKTGALEVLMPGLQPAELWQETGRWDQYGAELARLKDRHGRDFCLGPTHEEIITDMARHEIKSYKQLPITYFQIQTKFRDEIRPRFGVMRSREFIMKDAYSFHLTEESLHATYEVMYAAYTSVFTQLGLKFRAVIADSGSIGGAVSHEFHVLADSGEDAIAFSTESEYAANVESAKALPVEGSFANTIDVCEPVEQSTPTQKTIAEISEFLNVPPQRILKTLAIMRKKIDSEGKESEEFMNLFLRGDHELNLIKADKLLGDFRFATDAEIIQYHGCEAGFIGPKLDEIPNVIFDDSTKYMRDFVCGANKTGFHLQGYNWSESVQQSSKFHDIRNVIEGDASPDGKGTLTIARGIEVGHIFQLGTKYSEAMKAGIINENGKNQIMIMGCYGIGISRVVAAAIEQNHDSRGIIWSTNLAPFQVAICPMNMHKSERLREATEALYQELMNAGIEVLLDDRKVRAGFMFSDMDLIGIPHLLVMGDKGLDAGTVEYKSRTDEQAEDIAMSDIVKFIQAKLH
jgi:prolyl-tRNA synthetase